MATGSNSGGTPLDSGEPAVLTAFRTGVRNVYPEIVPAAADREWMDATGGGSGGWANRCLPLRIANQHGWFILNDSEFEVIWGGKDTLDSVKILYKDQPATLAASMFGYGIMTFVIPYVFRTPPGFNLLVRGPANLWKDGISPLEGITETDWLPYSFTMNWRLTRRLKPVTFLKGEPIAMIVPVRRHEVESFSPHVRNMESDAELKAGYDAWHAARLEAVRQAGVVRGSESAKQQGQYIRGEGHVGERAMGHQMKLRVKAFEIDEPPAASVAKVNAVATAAPNSQTFLQKLFGRRQS